MIPKQFQDANVYLRTAVSVETGGWAKFDYVKMPEYRWGILLAPQVEDRKIAFGEHSGEKAFSPECSPKAIFLSSTWGARRIPHLYSGIFT